MKIKITPSLFSLFLSIFLFGGVCRAATYIVPPDIDNLRQSLASPQVRVISHATRDTTKVIRIKLNNTLTDVKTDCVLVKKIYCRLGTTAHIYADMAGASAITKDDSGSYVPIAVTVYFLKAFDAGSNWEVCAIMGDTKGEALLTDHDTLSGVTYTYDPNNPSYMTVSIKQVCQ